MSKIVNLEEIIKPYRKYLVEGIDGYKNISGDGMFIGDVLQAMKEACRQVLELATENARTKTSGTHDGGFDVYETIVNRQSILDTINLIE